MKYIIYWIHYSNHTDPYTQGYIGISKSFEKRQQDHRAARTNKFVAEALNTGAIFTKLHSDRSEDDALKIEAQYRPRTNIGWNIAKGGGLPPSSTNHSSESRARRGASISKLIWVNDGNKNYRCTPDQLPEGASKGRVDFIPPATSDIIYTFSHKKYGIFTGTRREFIHAFPDQNIKSSEICYLLNGRYKTHRGWSLTG